MVRTPYIDENGLKKGAWSVEEDDKLRAYVQRYGHWNWREIPKFAGLARCGKSCRLRWLNYLRPNVKLGSYTKDEEDLIIKLHLQLGNRWSKIAASLPGRTDNEIKNYWHTHLKKRVTQQQPSTLTSKPRKRIEKKVEIKDKYDLKDNNVLILESYPYPLSPLQPQQSNHINNNINSSSIPSSSSSSSSSSLSSSSSSHHDQENNTLCSWDFNDELLDGSFWNQPFFTESCYEQDDYNDNNNNFDFDFDFNLFDQSLCSPIWDSLDFSCSIDF